MNTNLFVAKHVSRVLLATMFALAASGLVFTYALAQEEQVIDEQPVVTEEVVIEVPVEEPAVVEPVEEPVIEEVVVEPQTEEVPPTEEVVAEEPAPTPAEESVATVVVEPTPAPELTTDKDDYHPGETATIFGRFFAPVTSFLVKIFGSDENDENYTETTEQVETDEDGSFSFTYLLDQLYRPFYEVAVLAVDTGEKLAETWFRDAAVSVYDQCSNDDGDGYATGDQECRFINGAINGNNSTYQEGDSTLQRLSLDGFAPGTSHSVTVQYGTTKQGKHAYDFLTSWNHSESWSTVADRCDGIAGCTTATETTLPIPNDTNGSGQFQGTVGSRNFVMRGGTLSGASSPVLSGSYAGDSETSITINFTVANSGPLCSTKGQVTSCGVVLWFGAHIARTSDWVAFNNTTGAGSISGSPYHVAITELDGGSVGNRDNQMQASAIPSTIIIRKDTVPDASQDFAFTTTGTGLSNFTIDDDGEVQTLSNTKIFTGLNSGNYTVTETAVPGYVVTINCVDASGNTTVNNANRVASIALADGETVECTFTNTLQTGHIIVDKVTVPPGDTQSFNFDVSGGTYADFSLTDVANPNNQELTAGTYAVSETVPAGWDLSSAICSDGSPVNAISLQAGETVTCTFTNTKQSTLTLTKTVVNDNGGTAVANDFQGKIDGGNVAWGVAQTVSTGAHTASETTLSGYSASVWGGDCASNGTITLAAGENKTCSITNDDDAPSLTLVKEVINDNGGTAVAGDWDLIADGYDTQSPDAGTYDLSEENGPAGYTKTSLTCDNAEGQVTEVTLGLGEDVTCTFVNNDQQAYIMVVKEVTNDNGGSAEPDDFDLTLEGSAVLSGVAVPVNPGTYTADETLLSGYTFEGFTGDCDENGDVTVALGESKTCTLTNNDQQAYITVVKVVVNDNGGVAQPNDFALKLEGDAVTSGVAVPVNPGTYTASETLVSGYSFTGFSGDCDSNGGTTVALGQSKTCTLTNNDDAPSLTLVKRVVNDNGGTAVPGDWILTATGYDANSPQTGTYNLSESGPTGYSQTSLTCSNAQGQVTSVTLGLGEDVTCTFVNDDIQPELTVIKHVVNNYGGTADAGDFSMLVNATNPNPNGQFPGEEAPGTLVLLDAGVYGVAESVAPGYSPSFGDNCAGTIAIGEKKTCIVTNSDLPGSISGYKFEDKDGDGVWDNGEPALAGWTILLNGGPTSEVTDENGHYEFTDLAKGSYTVTETQQAGWTQTTANPATIELDNGENVANVNFGNFKLVSISGAKYEDVAGDGAIAGDPTLSEWTIRLYDTNENPWELVEETTTDSNGAYTFTGLFAGSYKVCEVLEDGWIQTFASVQGGNTSPNASEEGQWCVTRNVTTSGSNPSAANFGNYEAKDLTVSKTANTTYTRTFRWTIDKSVTPSTLDMFEGDSDDVEYTVEVTKDAGTDSDWSVTGTITISNPNPVSTGLDAAVTSVADSMTGGINAAVNCPSDEVPAGGSLVCTYSANVPNADARTNTATIETTGIVGGGEGFAEVTFGVPTTLVNDTVNVDDTNGDSWQFGDDGDVSYSKSFMCDEDEGIHNNTATIRETEQDDIASVTVNCHDLTVTKTVDTSYTRTFDWSIEKSVEPSTLDMFEGDSDDVDYEVTVTKLPGVDSDFAVAGTINITNNAPIDATLAEVTDSMTGGLNAVVDCDGAGPYVVEANGGTLECTYSRTLADKTSLTNTATAVLQNTPEGTTNYTDSADVTFGEPSTLVNNTVSIEDLLDENLEKINESISASKEYTYSHEYTCDSDEGEHKNVATVTGDTDELDSAEATVQVNCYDLTVTKDASTSFTRTWTWTIDKTGSETTLDLAPGQVYPVNYEVMVDADSQDSDWAVEGTITVTNPAPMAATLASVVDTVSDAIGATVTCPSLTVPANGSLVCTYETDLPDSTNRTNTAVATLDNGTAYNGTAAVNFAGATMTEVDESIDLTDNLYGNLGTVAASEAPKTFEYTENVGPYEQTSCGVTYQVDNAATLTTNDTGSIEDDLWTVDVNVKCVCSLTQGFWKTHNESFKGGAPAYDGWLNLGDTKELTLFYSTGMTWFNIFWTAPKGNVYYNLAHQYMAAKLNVLNGAWGPTITADIAAAEVLLSTYTPDQLKKLKGKVAVNVGKQFTDLAGKLGAFNEGTTNPAGHCSEPPIVSSTP